MTDDTRHRGDKHEGPAHASPYPMSRLAPVHGLVDVAREIEKADAMISSVVSGKLEIIARQIRALQSEALEILAAADRDARLHRAECRFRRRPGEIYHLYARPDGSLYFSIVSPVEWGGQAPHPFQGSYRLETDMRWTPVEEAVREPEPRGP